MVRSLFLLSRATILTDHSNDRPPGGYPKFISQGYNSNYLPLWLQSAGYNTYYTGKLFNAHHVENYHSPYVAGWNGSVSFPRSMLTKSC